MFVSNIKEKYWLSADNKSIHRTTYKGSEWKVNHLMHPEYELRGVYKDSGDCEETRVLMYNKRTERFFWYLVA